MGGAAGPRHQVLQPVVPREDGRNHLQPVRFRRRGIPAAPGAAYGQKPRQQQGGNPFNLFILLLQTFLCIPVLPAVFAAARQDSICPVDGKMMPAEDFLDNRGAFAVLHMVELAAPAAPQMQMPAAVGQQLVEEMAAVPFGKPLDTALFHQLGDQPVEGALADRGKGRVGRHCRRQPVRLKTRLPDGPAKRQAGPFSVPSG